MSENTVQREISQAKRESMKRARDEWSESHAMFTSPRERGEEKTRQALAHVYAWGWSSPSHLDACIEGSGGVGRRLVKRGFLQSTPTPTGGVGNTPAQILTLTQAGLDYISEYISTPYKYDTRPERVKFNNLVHDDLIQKITINQYSSEVLDCGLIYKTSRQLQNIEDMKKPDAIWELSGKNEEYSNGFHNFIEKSGTYAVELELTPKWGNEFDRLIHKTRNIIEEGICTGAIYIFRSRANLERYRKAMAAGANYKTWKKQPGKTGRWLEMGTKVMPKEIADKIHYYVVEGCSLKTVA